MTHKIDPKVYLEYLDKEMTLMGILSALPLLATGGILSTLLTSDKPAACELWSFSHDLILASAVLCIFAASFFYKQRSKLAGHHGQISLTYVKDERGVTFCLRDLLKGADSWASWWPYSWGWSCLIGGLVGYFLGLASVLSPIYVNKGVQA